jgi:hypothetical protein
MATQADVRRIALALPETEEAVDRFAFSVRNKGKLKGFVWVWVERVEPKKARVPQPDVIAVRVASLAEKDRLLDLDPAKYFTEAHLHGGTLRGISRHSCEPADDNRPRAQATHQRGLAVPSPEGSQGMMAAGPGCTGRGAWLSDWCSRWSFVRSSEYPQAGLFQELVVVGPGEKMVTIRHETNLIGARGR